MDKALNEAADQLPVFPDGSHRTASSRKATALVALCITDDPPPAQITVFVDTDHADAHKRGGGSGPRNRTPDRS